MKFFDEARIGAIAGDGGMVASRRSARTKALPV